VVRSARCGGMPNVLARKAPSGKTAHHSQFAIRHSLFTINKISGTIFATEPNQIV